MSGRKKHIKTQKPCRVRERGSQGQGLEKGGNVFWGNKKKSERMGVCKFLLGKKVGRKHKRAKLVTQSCLSVEGK